MDTSCRRLVMSSPFSKKAQSESSYSRSLPNWQTELSERKSLTPRWSIKFFKRRFWRKWGSFQKKVAKPRNFWSKHLGQKSRLRSASNHINLWSPKTRKAKNKMKSSRCRLPSTAVRASQMTIQWKREPSLLTRRYRQTTSTTSFPKAKTSPSVSTNSWTARRHQEKASLAIRRCTRRSCLRKCCKIAFRTSRMIRLSLKPSTKTTKWLTPNMSSTSFGNSLTWVMCCLTTMHCSRFRRRSVLPTMRLFSAISTKSWYLTLLWGILKREITISRSTQTLLHKIFWCQEVPLLMQVISATLI